MNYLSFQASGVRTIAFHPDGRTLFCGLDDSLKVCVISTPEFRPKKIVVSTTSSRKINLIVVISFTLTCKVYSWEPIIRHDAVDMGWSTMGDICIHEDKLLGCSYFQNSVGVWVADITVLYALLLSYSILLDWFLSSCNHLDQG